jgi:hypothetical protein
MTAAVAYVRKVEKIPSTDGDLDVALARGIL